MAAIRRTPTTVLGGHGNRTELSVIAAIFSSPWVFLRPANDNAPIRSGRKPLWLSVGIGLMVGVPVLLAVTLL
jgi:hypothetical protein